MKNLPGIQLQTARLLSLLLAVLVSAVCFAGCGSEAEVNEGLDIPSVRETKLLPDPELTGALTVSSDLQNFGNEEEYFTCAVNKFKELYPNVALTVEQPQTLDEAIAWSQRMAVEIMAGKGPDVFTIPQDPYKLIKSGVLLDLYSRFAQDSTFNPQDYNQPVFHGGQPEGKQYIVPLSYGLPLFLTTQSITDATGFDYTKCTSYLTTGEEIARVTKENKLDIETGKPIHEFYIAYSLPNYLGVGWMNPLEGTVDLSSSQLKQAYEMLKDDFFTITDRTDGAVYGGGDEYLGELARQNCCFAEISSITCCRELLLNCSGLFGAENTPVAFPWRNANGKVTANVWRSVGARGNTENPEAAYRFIKLLIDPEIQSAGYNNIGPDLATDILISDAAAKDAIYRFSEGHESVFVGNDRFLDYPPLPKEFLDLYWSYTREVDSVFFDASYTAYEMMRVSMQPYLEGSRSYEDCIADAQAQLEIYVSE